MVDPIGIEPTAFALRKQDVGSAELAEIFENMPDETRIFALQILTKLAEKISILSRALENPCYTNATQKRRR